MTYVDTGLWADVRELPTALGDTLAAADGIAEAAGLLRGAERIVATGNGAAYYVAHALWLASLEGERSGPPIVAVPCGVAVRERFLWQPGDAVLAVSSSGEFRDVVEIAQRVDGRPCVAITATPDSALATAATATVVQRVASQRAVTHTQALAGAYACGLALWARLSGDAGLGAALAGAPVQVVARLERYGEPLGEAFQLLDDLRDGDAVAGVSGRDVRKLIAEATDALDPDVLHPDAVTVLAHLADLVAAQGRAR
jgi:fructoselysine-6-P-deglycase FrlB-like protein